MKISKYTCFTWTLTFTCVMAFQCHSSRLFQFIFHYCCSNVHVQLRPIASFYSYNFFICELTIQQAMGGTRILILRRPVRWPGHKQKGAYTRRDAVCAAALRERASGWRRQWYRVAWPLDSPSVYWPQQKVRQLKTKHLAYIIRDCLCKFFCNH